MAQFDWDKVRRQSRVASHGAEPSEFTDITEQIATAKGMAKAHGPWLRACAGCGRYYDERYPDQHVCPSRPKPKKIKCQKCAREIDVSCIRDHMRHHREDEVAKARAAARLLKPSTVSRKQPQKAIKVKCRYCGCMVNVRGLKQHNDMKHWLDRLRPRSNTNLSD